MKLGRNGNQYIALSRGCMIGVLSLHGVPLALLSASAIAAPVTTSLQATTTLPSGFKDY